jgi:hypothetical protein
MRTEVGEKLHNEELHKVYCWNDNINEHVLRKVCILGS